MGKVLILLALLVFTVSACGYTANDAGKDSIAPSKESSPGYTANVAGNWTVTMAGPRSAVTLDLVIEATGSDLTISGTHSRLGDVAGSGTLDGDAIVMTVTATGERKLGYKLEGTVTGDKMAGTREIDRSNITGGARGGGAAGGGARGGGAAEGGAGAGGGRDRGSVSNEWTAERK